MTLSESFVLISFALFSLADLRYRLVPGIEFFFFGTILLALSTAPLQAGIILLAAIWGLLKNVPGWFAFPFLFYPATWPVLLIGYGYRKGIIGRADLLAICGLACLFPMHAVLLSLFGLECWRRFWIRRQQGSIPALPGLFIGMVIYLSLKNL
jgi:hypothetical protein